MWLNGHLHQYKGAHKYDGWRGTQISRLETRPSSSPPIKDAAPWAGETLVPLTHCGRISADHFTDWRGGSRRAGKKQTWKNKETKVWKGPVICKQGLISTPVCPFPMCVLHSLLFSFNSISNYTLGWETL